MAKWTDGEDWKEIQTILIDAKQRSSKFGGGILSQKPLTNRRARNL